MACACMTERFSQVQIDLDMSLEGAVWPTACLHANRCRTLSATVRRAGAEAEAGVRRGWQAAQLSRGKVCCLSIFCLASNDAVVHENDPRPQARAHRGLRIRPRRMLGCMRSMWASFLMPWPMPMQHAVLCARAWSARELRSCSSPAAKKPGRRHRRRWMHALCLQSCLHAMQCHF